MNFSFAGQTPVAAGRMVLAQMVPHFPQKEIVRAVKLQSQTRPLKTIKTFRHLIVLALPCYHVQLCASNM